MWYGVEILYYHAVLLSQKKKTIYTLPTSKGNVIKINGVKVIENVLEALIY